MPVDQRVSLAYYTQARAAGRQEAFAEAFAIHLGGGSDAPHREAFRRGFPRVLAYLRDLLRDYRRSR